MNHISSMKQWLVIYNYVTISEDDNDQILLEFKQTRGSVCLEILRPQIR